MSGNTGSSLSGGTGKLVGAVGGTWQGDSIVPALAQPTRRGIEPDSEVLPEVAQPLGPPPTARGDDYLQARLLLVRQEYSRVLGYLRMTRNAWDTDVSLKANWEMGTWKEANQCLRDAYGLLECRRPDARAAAGAIWPANQLLVWYRNPDDLGSELIRLARQLEGFGLHSQAAELLHYSSPPPNEQSAMDYSPLCVATITAMGQLAQHQQEEWINDDLQARLRHLLVYVSAGLALTLAATLIMVNPSPLTGWPVQALSAFPSPLSALITSLGLTVIGAAGGLFSGLLITQRASATLIGYRTSVLRLQLKPLVGGLAACLTYMPLSWQVVPGITVESGGTFLLIAFATGFSERYILRLLNVTSSDREKDDTPPPERRIGLHPEPSTAAAELGQHQHRTRTGSNVP